MTRLKLLIFTVSICLIMMSLAVPLLAKSQTNVVRIPDYPFPQAYPPYIAEELGFFREEGIDARFTGNIPLSQQVSAVVAGTNDVGTLHINRTISGKVAGAKIKAVVAWTETRKDRPHMTFLALSGLKFDKPSDLLLKKVGIPSYGGCNEYTPYEYLKKNGIKDPKGKFQFVIVPIGKEEQALRQGSVDVVGFHGWPTAVVKRGSVKPAFTDYEVWETVGGATPFYFSEKFIKENPETVRGFVKAIARANDWCNANPAKANQIIAKRFKIDITEVSTTYAAPKGIITEDSVNLWLKILEGYKELKPGQFKPSDIYTNEFNPYVKKHL